jgi:hypothetical protein
MIQNKNLFIKILSFYIYKQKGSVLNRFNSILSPTEYQEMTSLRNAAVLKSILNYIAPIKYLGTLKRVGGKFDGSYVVPLELLNDKTYLLSGGIADNNKFEIYAASKGVTGLQIDNSIIAPPQLHANMEFVNATLSNRNNHNHISLKTLIEEAPKNKKILLKIDIEGGEINAVGTLPKKTLKKIHCLVIEIHNLSSLTTKECKIPKLLHSLNSAGLKPVYLQANNACLTYTLGGILIPDNIEVTYVKKDKTTKLDISYINKIRKLAERNKQNVAQINIDHIIFRNL